MAELVVELIPSMLALLLTPAAIAGAILLLGSPRPYANSVSFMGGFALVYTLLVGVVVVLASVNTPPLLSVRTKAVVELVAGGALLLTAAIVVVRRQRPHTARKAKRGVLARLADATPRFAFGIGLALAAINPNVAILIAGLAVVAAAETGHAIGALLLLLAAVSGILIPVLWRWLAPESASRHLARIKVWIASHDTAINVAMLLVFGAVFTIKGMSDLV